MLVFDTHVHDQRQLIEAAAEMGSFTERGMPLIFLYIENKCKMRLFDFMRSGVTSLC